MLDKKVFLQGINYLKAVYLNWNFDLNNNLAIQIWYKKVSNLENTEYMQLVENYTDNNKWAPNSPNDLLEAIKSANSNGTEAWEWVKALNMQYPLDNEFQKPKFYQELKKDSIAYDLFNELACETIFNGAENINQLSLGNITYFGFGNGYKKDKFIKWYNARIQPKEMLRLQTPSSNNLLPV